MTPELISRAFEGLVIVGALALIRRWWKSFEEADRANQATNAENKIALERANAENKIALEKANAETRHALEKAIADAGARTERSIEAIGNKIATMTEKVDRIADKVTDHAARIEMQGREASELKARLLDLERQAWAGRPGGSTR